MRADWIYTRPRIVVAHLRTSIVLRPATIGAAHGCLIDRA
jgi:hypothetical protein